MTSVKKKKCKICKTLFPQYNSLHVVCSPKCAADHARLTREKRERKELKEGREKLMTKSDHHALTQKAFNRWIRARDYGQVCISCQKPPKKRQAGHYRSVGAQASLRYCASNCHLQCYHCNVELSSNSIEYRINLVKKLGVEVVEWLETDHPAKHYTIDELIVLRARYNKLARELEKEHDG